MWNAGMMDLFFFNLYSMCFLVFSFFHVYSFFIYLKDMMEREREIFLSSNSFPQILQQPRLDQAKACGKDLPSSPYG